MTNTRVAEDSIFDIGEDYKIVGMEILDASRLVNNEEINAGGAFERIVTAEFILYRKLVR